MPVGRLQERLKIAPSTLSHHIKALVVVASSPRYARRTTLICHANYDVMRGLIDFLVAECCAEGLPPAIDAKLQQGRVNFFALIFR